MYFSFRLGEAAGGSLDKVFHNHSVKSTYCYKFNVLTGYPLFPGQIRFLRCCHGHLPNGRHVIRQPCRSTWWSSMWVKLTHIHCPKCVLLGIHYGDHLWSFPGHVYFRILSWWWLNRIQVIIGVFRPGEAARGSCAEVIDPTLCKKCVVASWLQWTHFPRHGHFFRHCLGHLPEKGDM